MKTTLIREFLIGMQRFHLADNAGQLMIRSIHPYDETNYHWARLVFESVWYIYRDCRRIDVLFSPDGSEIEPETVAQLLLRHDEEAGLKRTGGIW